MLLYDPGARLGLLPALLILLISSIYSPPVVRRTPCVSFEMFVVARLVVSRAILLISLRADTRAARAGG